jgi:hypothetical protein
LETQLNTLTPIGQLALEEGIISPRDIFDVLRAQNESPNIRFGDLAIELGLMNRDDLMRLLMIQGDRKRPLAAILVGQGVLTKEQSAAELAEFRQTMAKRRASGTTPSKIVTMRRSQLTPAKTADATTAV